LGREALLKIKANGVSRKLVCLTSDDPHAMALGSEPILSLAGDPLGYVSNADYGYSVGKLILFGYISIAYAEKGTQVQVMYFDKTFTATVADDPLFDPKMTRLKA
jgi:glycine cleavage system aminomethyltransferase T